MNIDQKSENFQVVGSIRMEWDDPGLAFETGEHERNFKIFSLEAFTKHVDQQGIFALGFLVHNQQDRRFKQMTEVTVFKNGHAIYLERFTATLQAPEFDFIQHPFDRQVFFFHVDAVLPIDFVRFKVMKDIASLGGNSVRKSGYSIGVGLPLMKSKEPLVNRLHVLPLASMQVAI